MPKLLVALLLSGAGLLTAPVALAQAPAPDFPAAPPAAKPGLAPSPEQQARERQRASMNPEEAKLDQQMEILERRAGNTSFSRAAGSARQYESGRGGFTVKKFKAAPGSVKQERGMTRPMGAIDPKGKPLTHQHGKRKRFLLF